MVKAALILLCLMLAACATTPAPATEPRRIWCDHNQPRRPSVEAIQSMTRIDLDEINAHNGRGALWCGWTP